MNQDNFALVYFKDSKTFTVIDNSKMKKKLKDVIELKYNKTWYEGQIIKGK